ncbi:MAG: hypothetical protein QM725_00985 [Lacibacter sp.]
MKIWHSYNQVDTKVIVLNEEFVYLANPKVNEVDDYVQSFKAKIIPDKKVFCIPLSYINRISLIEGKTYLKVEFRGSYEDVVISDNKVKQDVFDYFKTNYSGFKYAIESYSKVRAGKKQLIALLVITVLFSWSFYLAKGMEKGIVYDVEGEQYHSLAGIVLVLSSLGSLNLMIIFGALLILTTFLLIKNIKKPPVIHHLLK